MSKSLSHTQYPNHTGAEIQELFEPTYVKLDKQVSKNSFWTVFPYFNITVIILTFIEFFLNQVLRFYGYFKEAVVESRLENFRIRKLIIYYFLEDRSILIVEPKVVNAGAPQGAFLNRQMVLKQDGSQMPFEPFDFRVGLDIGICGRSIRIYDCDVNTRAFFSNMNQD